MQIKACKLSRNIQFVLMLTLLQCAIFNQCLAAENPFPESSTAFIKLQELRDRASDLTVKAMDMLGIRYKRGGNQKMD
jgi:hypothetical protein